LAGIITLGILSTRYPKISQRFDSGADPMRRVHASFGLGPKLLFRILEHLRDIFERYLKAKCELFVGGGWPFCIMSLKCRGS
jgi:hypothetical protein